MDKEKEILLNAYIDLASNQIQKGQGFHKAMVPIVSSYYEHKKGEGKRLDDFKKKYGVPLSAVTIAILAGLVSKKLVDKIPEITRPIMDIRDYGEMLERQRGGASYDYAVNALTSNYNKTVKGLPKDKTRKLKDGEKHAIFKSKRVGFEDTLQPSLFAGPKSHITNSLNELMKRAGINMKAKEVYETDPELFRQIITNRKLFDSDTDVISMTHDVRYSLDAGDNDAIREADNKMLQKLEDVRKEEGLFNYLPSYTGIKLKTLMENVGLFSKGSFAGDAPDVSPEDKEMYEFIKSEMTKAGYGRRIRPSRK